MDPKVIDKIKTWLKYNDKIKEISRNLNKIKQERSSIEEEIIEYMKKNNLDNTRFNLGTHSLLINTSMILPPITKPLIEEILIDIFKNRNTVETILSRLERKRENNRKKVVTLKKKKNNSSIKKQRLKK